MVTSSGEDENIYEELKEIKKFDLNNPLVVTNDLMVINGNRRLSSLRELYYSSKGDYPNFSKIPCAIDYDDLTEKDIGMREVYHQMKKILKRIMIGLTEVCLLGNYLMNHIYSASRILENIHV